MNVLFLGLAKNCRRTLPGFFDHLDALSTFDSRSFRVHAVLGENGSRDGTRQRIEERRAADPRVELFDTTFMGKSSNRLRRMAVGREALLQKFAKHRRVDYVIVCDLDDVMLIPPHPAAVLRAIERLLNDPKLFAVGATSYPYFYDLLALRAGGIDYSMATLSEIELAKQNPLFYYRFQKRRLYDNRKQFTSNEPIEVQSSFNGYVIYNAADYILGTYRGPDEHTVCEHVTLHERIVEVTGKHMMIVPELRMHTPHEHLPVGFTRFWWDRSVKLAKRLWSKP